MSVERPTVDHFATCIRLDRLLDAPVEKVWRFLTIPELHARWWASGDIFPIVGHKFTLDMGEWGEQACEVVEVKHERLFRFLFSVGKLDTTITWSLAPEGDKTRLTLKHEGFNLDAPAGRFALEGMRSGWPAVLKRLVGAAK